MLSHRFTLLVLPALVGLLTLLAGAWFLRAAMGQPLCCFGRSPIQASAYGVICDGVTDTTAALQAAIDASKVGNDGLSLSMPLATGFCRITGTLTIANVLDWELQGNGVTFHWDGASTTVPMFLFQDVYKAHVHNFQVNASATKLLAAAIQIENGSGGTVTPSSNKFENIIIECTNGGCTNGIHIAQGAGGDNNNDFHLFVNMVVSNYAGAAARIDHSQSKTNVFEDFECAGNGVGDECIHVVHGSFHCTRCHGGGNVVDFYVVQSFDLITIHEGNFENSGRLLETGGPSSATLPISITNTRWSLGALNGDNRAIVYQQAGPLTVTGNSIDPATSNRAVEFWWNPGGVAAIGTFVAIGNYFGSTLANPFTGVQPTLQHSNLINRNDGAQIVALPSTLLMTSPPAQVLTAGATISADACGGLKRISAATPITTSTVNTFPAPVAWVAGCQMRVCNVGASAITLDQNANFLTATGNNVVLAAKTATAVSCIGVVETDSPAGTFLWLQTQ